MRSSTLICLVGSLVSLGTAASAQDIGDGTGYFRGAAPSVVTGDGTGYFRGVAPSAPPPPRAPVTYASPTFTPGVYPFYWPFAFPSWSWMAHPMMGSRLFPHGYGTTPAPLLGSRRFLDLPLHRRSAR